MLREKPHSLFMSCRARHDEEWNWRARVTRESENLLRMNLKETLVRNRANREHPLGVIDAQATRLSACDDQCSDRPILELLFAAATRLGIVWGETRNRNRRNLIT